MCPMAHSDGHNAPRLIDELFPCEATMVDVVVVGFEDAVRTPIAAAIASLHVLATSNQILIRLGIPRVSQP